MMLALRTLQRGLGLFSTLVLARLLVPEDFAIVAIATIVVQLLDIICNTGSRQFLVQVEQIDQDTINTAWTMDIIFRGIAVALLFLSLPLVDLFWQNPSATAATAWMAPTLLLAALENPALHVDVRNLRFGKLFYLGLLKKGVGVLVVVGVALSTNSFWAIVAGVWASRIVGVIASNIVCTHRPRLCFSGFLAQWHFSKWIVSRGFIGYLRAQIDTLFASKLFGASLFGQYTLARELVVLPSTDIIVPLVQPLLSTFSRVRSNPAELSRQLCISLLTVATLVAPVCLLIRERGDLVLRVALGPGWEAAEAMVAPMVPMLFAFSFGGINHALLVAQGKVRQLFMFDVVSLTIVTLVLLSVYRSDVETFITARAVIEIFTTFGMLSWSAYVLSVPVWHTLALLFTPVAAAVLATFLTTRILVFSGVQQILPELVELVIFCGVTVALYAAIMFAIAVCLRKRSSSWNTLLKLVTGLLSSSLQRVADRFPFLRFRNTPPAGF